LTIRVFFVVVLVAALVGTALAVAHGYRTPAVPNLTIPG